MSGPAGRRRGLRCRSAVILPETQVGTKRLNPRQHCADSEL